MKKNNSKKVEVPESYKTDYCSLCGSPTHMKDFYSLTHLNHGTKLICQSCIDDFIKYVESGKADERNINDTPF